MRLISKLSLAVAAALAGILVVNTLRLPAAPAPAGAALPPPEDMAGAAARLGTAIRIQTVSYGDSVQRPDPFPQFHRLLESSFPHAHVALRREVINGASLLYTWPGSDPNLQPVLLSAHMDVVPVEAGSEAHWIHPPFSGEVADGFIWGRGSYDMKQALMASMEGVERLLASGYKPRRTVLLAFGHDEELGGTQGARAIADVLEQRGVRARFSLDEGSYLLLGFIPGATRPIAQIGLSEKGRLTLELQASAQGGHASAPPRDTAIGRLARAVARLEQHPMPASLEGPAGDGLRALAPALPFGKRLVLANTWLFGPLIRHQLSEGPVTNASMRTTIAVTMADAGVKENVLPASARAVLNVRLAPGDTPAAVKQHIEQAIGDPLVTIRELNGPGVPAMQVADLNGPGYHAITEVMQRIAPEAVSVPGLVIGGTDSQHYGRISDAVYRFVPLRLTPQDVSRYHGTNERISIANYGEIISFYSELLRHSTR